MSYSGTPRSETKSQKTRTEINLPMVLFVDSMRPFEKAANWPEALVAWCHTEAPSGHHPSNLATAERVQQISVIRSAVTNVVFRDGDLPKRTLSSDNDLIQHELARVETASFKLHSIMLADALDLIKTRFGIPTRDDLQKFMSMFGTRSTLARSLATAFQLYWTEDYDPATHLVVPKVETAARALLLELNEPLYRTAVGDSSGQFPALGTLLSALLACDFDPDRERFLRTFLLTDGSNVRNYIAHGFTDTIDRTTAVLALRAGVVLTLLTSNDATPRDTATLKLVLSAPVGPPPRRTPWARITAAMRAAWHELRR